MSANAIYGMQSLFHDGKKQTLSDPEDPDSDSIVTFDPFEMYISTWGGVAMNMFAIYDCMRLLREQCEIHTVGLGKVMSAGVLLLAAGTKGKRKIGANCRVMIHSVIGGHEGSLHNLENEMEEIRWIQNQHIKALISETSMTTSQLKKMLSRKMNIYLNAEEAVKLGIADEII
jgi:ATP-dependent Clp protease protease subunit